MKEKKQYATASYALVQGLYWMSFCIIFTFSSIYLLDRGFRNTEIGLLIAVSGAISAVLQPLAGDFADRKKNLSLRVLVIIISCLMLILAAGLFLAAKQPVMTLLFYGMLVVLLQVLTPLLYSLGMRCVNKGVSLNFGLARGIGSLAFAGISYLAGLLVAAVGAVVIPFLIAGIYMLLIVAVSAFRYDVAAPSGCEEEGAKLQQKGGRKETGFFKRYHRFLMLLAGAVLVFTSHNMINNFAFQIVQSKGGGSEAMGTMIALAAGSELPIMFLFGWMVKKVSSGTWLKISGVFFFIKALATYAVTGMGGMYLIQGLQMFGFALFVVASVYYVNQIMDEKDRVKGQAYMTMTNTLGSVLGSLAGGALIDMAGIRIMLLVSAGAAVAGMLLMGVSTE